MLALREIRAGSRLASPPVGLSTCRPSFRVRERTRAATRVLALLAALTSCSCGASEHGVGTEAAGLGGSGVSNAGAGGSGGVSGGGTAGVSGTGASGGSAAGSGGTHDAGGSGGMATGGTSTGGMATGGTSTGGAANGGMSGEGAKGGAAGNGGEGAGGRSGGGCPDAPPASGDSCPASLGGATCFYEDCSGTGRRTRATCAIANGSPSDPSMWIIDTWPCGDLVRCSGDGSGHTCPAGDVCLVLEGGTLSTQCVAPSCGTGPVECGCVDGCFDGCTESTGEQGATFTCSTCTDPRGCP